MGRVGMADTRLQAQREETTRVHQDPLMDEQSRQARLTELRGMREETMQRKNAALAQETAIRQEIAQRGESARVTAEANRETKTFGQAMRGLGGAVGGSLLTGGKDVARLAWRSGMVGQAGAMGAAVAGGAMGSNMLMMGGTGAMIGSMIPGVGTALGGAVGATAGLAMDAAKANNDVTDSIKELNQQATDAGKSGSGLAALAEATDQSKKKFQDYNKSMTALRQPGLSPLQSITTGYGQAKNFVEGLLGDSDVEEQAKKLNVTADKARNVADAFRDLAKAGGVKLTGSATAQRQQLDEFMASRGLPALGQANIELPDLIAARAKGGPQYQDMLDKAITPGKATGMWDRMRTTQVGAAMLDSPQMRKSLQFQNDIALAYDATNSVFEKMRKTGMSYLDIVKSAEKTQAQIGVEGGPEYSRAAALSQKAEYAIQMQAPQMGRIGAVQSQLALTQAVLATKPKTDTDAAEREAQKQAAASAIADQDQYFRSMILAQRAYERSRVRAQEDFSLQRQYQEYDYNMSRTRAEENFNRMRARAIADYHRSVTRAWSDFNLQRKRQEQDYQHQIEVTAQQRAISMNLYQRPETQRTSSATWLLSNTSKILSNLRTQKQHLNELRKLGFSDAVIQQLQLTDPNNAQELARFVAEVRTDRTMVGRFNRVAGQLSRASRALVTDSSSLDFKEMQRSFLQGRDRGMADMNRSMDRQHADFWRGLGQQRTDFNIMMDQQAQDYENQNNRQLKQYQTSMHRSAQDMAHMADEVTGSITDVLVTAHEELTGSAKKQAGLALKSFQDLRKSTKPEAVALMRELSQIFGFEYTNPLKGHGPAPIPSASNAHSGRTAGGVSRFDAAHPGMAQGGVVPGWSPGRDDKMVPVSGGEAVMRPEWARRVGKVAIDAMNHAAAHGGYAKGGIVWPLPSSNWSTYPGHDGIDLNAPNDLGKPFYAAAPGRISYTGWGHGYGDAIFETGPYGTLVYGHGSKVAVHAGQRVTAGQYIGNVGSTGHSTGPHLHIGFPGGTSGEILSFLHGAGHTGYGAAAPLGGLIDPLALTGVLKDRYPQAEKAAYNMDGVHPLNPGMISAIINRLGRRVAAKYARRAAPGGVNVVNLGNEPASNLTNEGIVHVGANRLGWGDQWPSLRQLVMHESGFNNLAQNPSSTAFGMFQFLNSTWAGVHGHKTADPWKQTQYGLQYIKDRYGNPAHAWDMWQSRSPHWYADGAVFNSPRQIGVGEGGPEAVIPLNQKGGEFLARSIGLDSAPMAGGSVSVANYRIDRSTNFTGPITVQANDPNELLAKLQARQRVRALTKPALSGSAA
jgi:murein DD-endopeptidase MepM/ murein hydrolase activator NlpD